MQVIDFQLLKNRLKSIIQIIHKLYYLTKKMVYHVIGLMSGTSLDGLDIAACRLELLYGKWNFAILAAKTVEYSTAFQQKLQNAHNLSAYEYVCLNNEISYLFANSVNQFMEEQQLAIPFDFIASHGHTVFHQPDKHLTTQLGNGAILSALCKLPVVCDFRTTDVAMGGQGAPLVPIGDKFLFADYDYCLNLGGFANISSSVCDNGIEKYIAYDICPANIVLNYLANYLGFAYDIDGNIARKGNVQATQNLLDTLNRLAFYAEKAPKSLGREWLTTEILPLLQQHLQDTRAIDAEKKVINSQVIYDLLACFTQHIAYQIAKNISKNNPKNNKKISVLLTGGGAFHLYLLELLQKYAPEVEIILPSAEIIQYKEALIFAFLGVLRWRQENNALQTVTGATKDTCGGAIYYAC